MLQKKEEHLSVDLSSHLIPWTCGLSPRDLHDTATLHSCAHSPSHELALQPVRVHSGGLTRSRHVHKQLTAGLQLCRQGSFAKPGKPRSVSRVDQCSAHVFDALAACLQACLRGAPGARYRCRAPSAVMFNNTWTTGLSSFQGFTDSLQKIRADLEQNIEASLHHDQRQRTATAQAGVIPTNPPQQGGKMVPNFVSSIVHSQPALQHVWSYTTRKLPAVDLLPTHGQGVSARRC